MNIFAAHNPDAEVRRESSAGGVFSMLAGKVIAEGGVVYGVGFDDDWRISHMSAHTMAELAKLRGSKYAYSDLRDCISLAVKALEGGKKVLFSGTPCQAAAMRKRAGENPNLLIVETVCHGAPEARYWDAYLSEVCQKKGKTRSDISGISFRDKRTGWKGYSFTIKFSDGSEFTQLHDDNLYMRAFLKDLTLRDACFRCPFKYPDGTRADITLGDFWGISQLAPEIDNNLGTTIIISRTDHGNAALTAAGVKTGKEYTLSDVARYNPAITTPATEPTAARKSFREEETSGMPIPRLLKQHAGRPLKETLYLRLARLKHQLLNSGK